MTERRRTTKLEDFRAPPGKHRVIAWHDTDAGSQTWIEADLDDEKSAKRMVDELRAAGAACATVFDVIGRRRYSRSNRQRDDREFPISVTRLAGLADPFKRTGQYRRR